MTESFDRAAIKARAEAAVTYRRRNPGIEWSEADLWELKKIEPYYATDVPALLAALEEAEREVERLKSAQHPCDGGCNYNSGPEETCSAHGRPVAEVWNIVEEVARQRDEAERRIAAVLDVVKELEADIPADPSNEVAHHIAKTLRAALHPVAETTESEKNDE